MTLKVIVPYESMSTELIGVGDLKGRKVKFPYRCVFCGGPAEKDVLVHMPPENIRDLKRIRLATLWIPYCRKDEALNEKYKKQYDIVIGVLCSLIILITVFSWYITDQPAESYLVLVALVAGGIFLVNKILLMVVPRFLDSSYKCNR